MIIRNEADFEERRTYNFTYAKVISILLILVSITMGLSLLLSKYLRAEWINPEHELRQLQVQVATYSHSLDSLESVIDRKDKYILSFKRILDPNYQEEEVVGVIFEPQEVALTNATEETGTGMQMEAVSNRANAVSLVKRYFIKPIQEGSIVDTFNFENRMYGVKLSGPPGQGIQTIDDGEVVLCNWDKDEGYVIAIEHSDDLISIYKQNEILLKKVGTFVQSGEIIALSNSSSSSSITQIELWSEGNPIDPTQYIEF